MEPIYKIGDKVRIVKRIGNSSNYRFGFVDEMANMEGQVHNIKYIGEFRPGSYLVPDDGYYYSLEDSGGFSWASSMFEPVREEANYSPSKEEPKVLDFTPKKKHYKLNFSV